MKHMEGKIYCKKCGRELKLGQKFCDNCGTQNNILNEEMLNIENKKREKKAFTSGILTFLILCVILCSIVFIDRNNRKNNSIASNEKSQESKDKREENIKVIFDAKKLIGASKSEVDNIIGTIGKQDEKERYSYKYGNDINVIFDNNNICLSLILNTDDKRYKSYDDIKILKSYGVDLVDSQYYDMKVNVKYNNIKDYTGEIEIFYEGDRLTDMSQIVFYTETSEKVNEFLISQSKKQ